MDSNLYGNKFKRYYSTYTSSNYVLSDIIDAYSTANYIDDVNLTWATAKKSVTDRDTTWLYSYDAGSQVSDIPLFRINTVAKLDEYFNNWQLMTFFVVGADSYTGKVPVSQVLSLFPYHYDATIGTYYFTNDDIDIVFYLVIYQYSDSLWYTSRTGIFSKSGISISGNTRLGINVLTFNDKDPSSAKLSYQVYAYFDAILKQSDGYKSVQDRHFTRPYGSNQMLMWPSLSTTSSNIYNYLFTDVLIENYTPPSPYNPGGTSGTGGGSGTYDGSGDDIDIPNMPTLSAADTGLISLYNPTVQELKNMANFLWSDAFSLDSFKKMFANPMDAILGLSIVPVAVPNGGVRELALGNVTLTGVSMIVAGAQYVEVDCGSIFMNEYWGAYLDYDPYTQVELYLPYIGIRPIRADDIMNKTIRIVYHVDILSGACCAYVQCGGTILYSFVGACSCSVPVTASNYTEMINGIISIAGAVGTMVATGGLSAAIPAASIGSGISAVTAIKESSSIASTVANNKVKVEKSGGFGSMGGMLGVQKPYLIITRPRQCLPENQNVYTGYPCYMTLSLGNVTGFTQVEEVYLSGMTCTDEEKNEIETLLKEGVIF